jgi:3-deoxy-7-phosphoheptulonate synthase / chorismate mutase
MTGLSDDLARDTAKQIAEVRAALDKLNLELLRKLEARGRLVQEVMFLKELLSRPAYDPERERQMLEAVLAQAEGVYSQESLRAIFSSIFAASRTLRPPG